MSDFSELKKVYQIAMSLVCQLSRQLMVDPVLLSNGKTYDRSSLLSFFDFESDDGYIRAGYRDPLSRVPLEDATMVPNNSIKSVIEQFVNTYESFELPMGIPEQEEEQTTEQQNAVMEWKDLLDLCRDYRARTSEAINIEEEYEKVYQTAMTLSCPLSRHLMVDPVINSNGDTYDRSSLEKFTSTNGYFDPKTLLPMTDLTIKPNDTMKFLIRQFVEMYEGKQGRAWERVVTLCQEYRAIIRRQQAQERREREQTRRQRLIDDAVRRATSVRNVPINFSHSRSEAYLNRLAEEARAEVRASFRPLSEDVISMNRRLAESAARRAARRASDREREGDE